MGTRAYTYFLKVGFNFVFEALEDAFGDEAGSLAVDLDGGGVAIFVKGTSPSDQGRSFKGDLM